MKIYSWNMLYRNEELDHAFDFITKSDFDVFCLQEVPKEFLARLRSLPFHIAFRGDVEKILPSESETVPMYNVILSRHPLVGESEISFDDYWPYLPLRTRLFVQFMPFKYFSRIRNRHGLYADVKMGDASVRVFCLHLVLAQPAWRLREFELAMAERDPAQPTIVCGDFNLLEKPHITPLNWLLGGRVSDAIFFGRERTIIERRFVENELVNPLRKKVTHRLSLSQLDHILVSKSFAIHNAKVLSDRIGSDHHPIRVEIA